MGDNTSFSTEDYLNYPPVINQVQQDLTPDLGRVQVDTEKTNLQIENEKVMNTILGDFPFACEVFVDSKNNEAIHIGLLTQNEDEINELKKSTLVTNEAFVRLETGSGVQQEWARYIKEMFHSQKYKDGVFFSKFGMSMSRKYPPIDQIDLSNNSDYITLTSSILEMDDEALEVFDTALKTINKANMEFKGMSQPSTKFL